MSAAGPVASVLCTVPPEIAQELAHRLVDEALAACVQIVPGVQSVYRWQGRVEQAAESLLIAKTSRPESLCAALRRLHPYETPEILVFHSDAALHDAGYAAWVAAQSAQETP